MPEVAFDMDAARDLAISYGPIIAAVVAGLFVLFLLKKLLFRGATGSRVLLTGLTGSGKTLMWSKLLWNGSPQTVTSQKENVGTHVTPKQKRLEVIDIPGFDKVRYRVLDKFSSSIRGIVFVVDAASVQRDVRDAAEYLYTILTDDDIQRSRPKTLIFCNKQDLDAAKSARAVKSLLEKEITILRETRASRLSGTSSPDGGDARGNNNSYLGVIGKDFEFSDLGKSKKIEFTEGSCLDAQGLQSVTKFLNDL